MEELQQSNETSNNDVSQEINQNETNQNDSNLIMGKFKSVEDLSNAYKNMESLQGQQSKEIGELRKKAQIFDEVQKKINENNQNYQEAKEYFEKNVPKYDNDDYFKNPEFSNLYKEAFLALGTKLDTDKFVSLVDNYVKSRISLYEKAKSAKSETENAKSSMQFSDSPAKTSSKTLPKLDGLSPEKIDEVVARYI